MTMASVEIPFGTAEARNLGANSPAIEVASDLDTLAPVWRAFEAEALKTPYGRFDWVRAFQASLPEGGRDSRVAILRDGAGDVILLAPFRMERRLGLTVAAGVGGRHANYNLPLIRPDFGASLTPDRARAILAETGRALGADMIALANVPVAWNGWPNPFAAVGKPAASDAWALRLEADGEAVLARSMSADARKKMRNKARGLAKLGDVRIARATTPEEVALFLEAHLTQKAQRFAELGIADPFADPAVRRFLESAATGGLAAGHPAIEVYALRLDDEVVAVIGGASDGDRFSGMVVSFQTGPLDRFSLGEMLVTGVIRDLCARGFSVFDLGSGEARYKRSICDEVEALVDVLVPLTLCGRAATLAEAGFLDVKRRIKASPRAMALVGRARRATARLRA